MKLMIYKTSSFTSPTSSEDFPRARLCREEKVGSQIYPWVEKVYIIKMFILPILIYRFNTILIRITIRFFMECNKLVYGQ